MEILPSEYQQIELSRSEKIFVRNVMSSERFGYLLIKTNDALGAQYVAAQIDQQLNNFCKQISLFEVVE